jgi:hypothetical protein
VKGQIEHWPLRGKQKKLQQDKVMKHWLLEVLLNPQHGFSTMTTRKSGTTQMEPQRVLSGNHASIPVSIAVPSALSASFFWPSRLQNPAVPQNLDTTTHQCVSTSTCRCGVIRLSLSRRFTFIFMINARYKEFRRHSKFFTPTPSTIPNFRASDM